jgi:hypothetical protein
MRTARKYTTAAVFAVLSVGTVGLGTADAQTPPPPPNPLQAYVNTLERPVGCVLPTVMGGLAGGSLGATVGGAAAGVGAPIGAAAGAGAGAGLATAGCILDEKSEGNVIQGHAVPDPDEVVTGHKGK